MHSFVATFALLSFVAAATIPAFAFADTTNAAAVKHKSVQKPSTPPKSPSLKSSTEAAGRPSSGQGE